MAKWRLPEFLTGLTARGQASGEAAAEEVTEVDDDRDPKLADRPLDRSILWLPGGWGEFQRGPPRKHELFVDQEVLRRVDAHAHERIEGAYGLLTGHLRVCRVTRVPFIHVEAAHRSDRALPVDDDLSSFREFFWQIREEVGRSGRIIVGWYHTHTLLGLQISERDRRLHVSHFHDDWPCALVVVSREGATEGGFFQRDRGETLFRRAARPFREIINQRVKAGGGPYATTVSWTNYWTEEPVLYIHTTGGQSDARTGWRSLQEQRRQAESDEERTLAELARAQLARSRTGGRGATESDALDRGGRDEPVGPEPGPPSGKPKRVDHAPRMPAVHRGKSTSSTAETGQAWEEWRKKRDIRAGVEEARRRRSQAVERAAMEAAKAIVEHAQDLAPGAEAAAVDAMEAAELDGGAEAAKARADAKEAEAAKAEAKAKARAEEETRARAEAEAREAEAAKAEAEAKARAEEETRARAEAEARESEAARAEAEAKARAEEETRARAEAEAREAEAARAEAEVKVRAEEETRARAEAKAREAEAARAEAEVKARAEEEARAEAEAAREAAEVARAEAEEKARAEAEVRSEAEAEAERAEAARAEAEEKAKTEEEARAAAEAAREAAEVARVEAEEKARAEAEARSEAEAEVERAEAARTKAEERAKTEEEARAAAEAAREAAEVARAEAEEKARTEEEARRRAEAEARAAEAARAEFEPTEVASAAWIEPMVSEPESSPPPAEVKDFEDEGEMETPLFVLPEGEPLQVRMRTWIPRIGIGIGFAVAALAAWLVFG
jgi:proteasome lid subunit RPN8/RPN11